MHNSRRLYAAFYIYGRISSAAKDIIASHLRIAVDSRRISAEQNFLKIPKEFSSVKSQQLDLQFVIFHAIFSKNNRSNI